MTISDCCRAVVLLAVLFLPALAQTGSVNGFVRDASSGEALAYCNVLLAGTSIGSVTDDTGYYYIDRVPPGPYVMEASHLGYEDERTRVVVTDGQETRNDVALTPRSIDIPPVVVGAKKKSFPYEGPFVRLSSWEVAVARTHGLFGLPCRKTHVDAVAWLQGIEGRVGDGRIYPTYDRELRLSALPKSFPESPAGARLDVAKGRDTWSFTEQQRGQGAAAYCDAWTVKARFRPGDTLTLRSHGAGSAIASTAVVPDTFRILRPSWNDTVKVGATLVWTRSPNAAGYAVAIEARYSRLNGEYGADRLFVQPIDSETIAMTIPFPAGSKKDWITLRVFALDSNLLRWLQVQSHRCCLFAKDPTAGVTGATGLFGACIIQEVQVWVDN